MLHVQPSMGLSRVTWVSDGKTPVATLLAMEPEMTPEDLAKYNDADVQGVSNYESTRIGTGFKREQH